MKKCIALVRVSTQKQILDEQRNEVISMALNDGYDEKSILVIQNKESAIKIKDESESLGLTTMFKMIEEDSSIDCVYVWELSRIGRKESVNLCVKEFLIKHHVNLKIKNPNISLFDEHGNVNPSSELVFSLFNTMSQQEMMIKKQRLMKGKKEAIERGGVGVGKPRFGYRTGNDKKIYIDELEGNAVRYIFKSYLEGIPTNKIYQECYEKGLLKKYLNRDSENGAIVQILRDKKYMGTVTSSGNVRYPQIVSEELWNKCAELRYKNKSNKKLTKNCYLGKGILSYKNWSLCGRNKRSYVGRRVNFTVAMNLIDHVIWDVTKDLQLKSDVTDRKEKLKQLRKNREDVILKLNTCDKHLKEVDEKVDRIDDIYSIGGKSKAWLKNQYSVIEKDRNDIIQRKNKLLNTLNDLDTSIRNFNANDYSSILSYGELDYFYNTNEKKKELIDKNIEKIEIKDGNVFKTIEITSKKYGKLNYFYQYIFNKHRRYTLFKVKYNEKGHKIMKRLNYK